MVDSVPRRHVCCRGDDIGAATRTLGGDIPLLPNLVDHAAQHPQCITGYDLRDHEPVGFVGLAVSGARQPSLPPVPRTRLTLVVRAGAAFLLTQPGREGLMRVREVVGHIYL